jgi:hypothetical protein
MAERDFTDIRPERIGSSYVEERSNVLPIIAAVFVIVAAIGYAGYYFYTNAEMFNPYRKTYEKLGIDLPRSFERFELASRYLDQVNREPCDNVAFFALAKLMESAGYPRESAKSLESYNRSCTFSEEMLQFAYHLTLESAITKRLSTWQTNSLNPILQATIIGSCAARHTKMTATISLLSQTISARWTCFRTSPKLPDHNFIECQQCTTNSANRAML